MSAVVPKGGSAPCSQCAMSRAHFVTAIGEKAMNLALWLERAGSSHGHRPALGLGPRVVKRYDEVAERAAKFAASLRHRFLLQPGERVAIAAKNCPDYVELMFGIWHAGVAAVPANAKLHGRELGYILEHS